MFSKILIANRGEIAVRIIRACKEMGIASVAVFSEADRTALHVSLADESICIGPARAEDSYLNAASILSAAVVTGAQAIHPGYGLLSENAEFAAMCESCNIAFIGPGADIIAKAGDKACARRTMAKAGIPVIPGCDGLESAEDAAAAAEKIGYPVMLKARAGGGGRGIRIINRPEELEHAYKVASAEARAAFGDGGMYLEKYLNPVKHIETQILADAYGNIVCLGERECSLQRKNQKLIEESPSPAVTPELRGKLTELSLRAAKTVGYVNAGTLEYLLDDGGNVYFMEMNTRLQVEHPVTELVTGIDIVKWQIRIASGMRLAFGQNDISLNGHAIECRINAENVRENYRPGCGRIELLHIPGGPWVRFDTAIYQDYCVPPFYDAMIGKLIVHAKTREEAIRKMRASLCELVIEGVEHNAELQMSLLEEEDVLRGTYHTDFLSGK